MKTQIIQLEAHDDTLSVRDKMDWAQAPRMLLVWPEGVKVLRARLDLILLERYATSHGSQLALLTRDPEVNHQAGKAGIPVFQSRRDAQLQPWGKSFREFQRQDLQRYKSERPIPDSLDREPPTPRKKLPAWARIPIFTLGVLSVLAIAGTLLPTAEISIQPEINHESMQIPFQAAAGGEEISLAGIVPGRELEIQVSAQSSVPTSGSVPIPTEYASGRVVFTNLGEGSVTIPKGTILSTEGDAPVLFQTLDQVSTPLGAGEQVEVEIEAQSPGLSGNVAENQIRLIHYRAGAELSVTNPQPTSGGEDLLIPAPDRSDREMLSNRLDRILEEKARQQIELALQDGDVLLSPELDDLQVIEESYSADENEPGDTLWLEKAVAYRVYYASGQDLKVVSSGLVQARYQDSEVQPLMESLSLTRLTDPVEDSDQHYSWTVQVAWDETSRIDQAEIISQVLGKTTQQAASAILAAQVLESDPQIQTWPGWWHRLPLLSFRITVNTGATR